MQQLFFKKEKRIKLLRLCRKHSSITTRNFLTHHFRKSVNLTNPATTGTPAKAIFNTIHSDLQVGLKLLSPSYVFLVTPLLQEK